jgi:RIO-like serine/threonine protein kinase
MNSFENPYKEEDEQTIDLETIARTKEFIENLDAVEGLDTVAVAEIKERLSDPERYLDKGGAAVVYTLSNDVCIKVLTDRHSSISENREHYDLGVSVEEEAEILRILTSFSKSGVRTPAYKALVKSSKPGGTAAIVMEQLNAVNLKHVLLGKEEMPSSFNREKFFEALETYLVALHEEMRFAHNDLEARNIMVDRETGLPYVIDFGRAKRLEGKEDTDSKKAQSDWDNIADMYEKTEKLDK